MNLLNKITKSRLALAMGAVLAISAVSCIEESENEVSGKGTSRIRLSTSDYSVVTLKPFAEQTVSYLNIYRDAVSEADMNQTVTVKLTISQDSLDAFNDREGADYLMVDPAWFSLYEAPSGEALAADGTSNTITFGPGESVKALRLEIDTNPMDLTAKYMLPVVITEASNGYEVKSTLQTAFVQALPINKYDAVYEVTGTMVDASNGTILHINEYRNSAGAVVTGNQQYALITSGERDNDVFDWDFYGNYYSPITSGSTYSRYGNFSAVFHFDVNDKIASVTNWWGQPNPTNGRYATVDPAAENQWTEAGIEGVGYRMHHPSVMGGAYNAGTPDAACTGCYGSSPRTVWAEEWENIGAR
jgi:hypothetical protein